MSQVPRNARGSRVTAWSERLVSFTQQFSALRNGSYIQSVRVEAEEYFSGYSALFKGEEALKALS